MRRKEAREKGLSGVDIGHAMQEAYVSRDIKTLTGEGLAAKPTRRASTPTWDEAAGNTAKGIFLDPVDVDSKK
ncbi:MAG: hypothetical protein JW920_12015 [Deltaproteobacteria bacterium]|nr:hypothetical protein [Deltaproteobacteria bacterium]